MLSVQKLNGIYDLIYNLPKDFLFKNVYVGWIFKRSSQSLKLKISVNYESVSCKERYRIQIYFS